MKRTLSLLILSALSTTAVCAERDIVWQGASKMTSGSIESVTPDVIRIKSNGQVRDVPSGAITKVRFGDDPSALTKVRTDVENGRLEDAQALAKTIKMAGSQVVQHDIAYYRALIEARLALQGRADVNQAAKLMNRFLSVNATSFRFYPACEVMGDLAMSLGRFESAAKFYSKLAKSQDATIRARGNLRQGDAWLRQDDVPQAESFFKDVMGSANPQLQGLGEIGLAKCLTKRGKTHDAIQRIEEVIDKNDSKDTALFARAYNALGDAHQADGNHNAALEAYLHTDLLFYREVDQHAEALFHLTKLWHDINKPAESSKARRTLRERYGASLWAKK